MAVGDLVSDGVLVRQVLVVEEVLPALRLVEVSNLRWEGGKIIFTLEWTWREVGRMQKLNKKAQNAGDGEQEQIRRSPPPRSILLHMKFADA